MRKALYILSNLEDSDIEWMAQKGKVDNISAESVLIKEGEPIGYLHIMLEGELSVRIGGTRGQEVAKLLSGEIVGEMSFVNARPPSASVVATQDSLLLSLDRTVLSRKLQADGPFAARFYRAVANFLADRLYVTVGRFGYGNHQQDSEVDQIDDAELEDVSIASMRFDQLLRRLRGDYITRGASVTV
jgi:CRP/FNR family transcriptional regulator, cyclic AMP receptor protein